MAYRIKVSLVLKLFQVLCKNGTQVTKATMWSRSYFAFLIIETLDLKEVDIVTLKAVLLFSYAATKIKRSLLFSQFNETRESVFSECRVGIYTIHCTIWLPAFEMSKWLFALVIFLVTIFLYLEF